MLANSEIEVLSLLEAARIRFDPFKTFVAHSPLIGALVDLGTLAMTHMSGLE